MPLGVGLTRAYDWPWCDQYALDHRSGKPSQVSLEFGALSDRPATGDPYGYTGITVPDAD